MLSHLQRPPHHTRDQESAQSLRVVRSAHLHRQALQGCSSSQGSRGFMKTILEAAGKNMAILHPKRAARQTEIRHFARIPQFSNNYPRTGCWSKKYLGVIFRLGIIEGKQPAIANATCHCEYSESQHAIANSNMLLHACCRALEDNIRHMENCTTVRKQSNVFRIMITQSPISFTLSSPRVQSERLRNSSPSGR